MQVWFFRGTPQVVFATFRGGLHSDVAFCVFLAVLVVAAALDVVLVVVNLKVFLLSL